MSQEVLTENCNTVCIRALCTAAASITANQLATLVDRKLATSHLGLQAQGTEGWRSLLANAIRLKNAPEQTTHHDGVAPSWHLLQKFSKVFGAACLIFACTSLK